MLSTLSTGCNCIASNGLSYVVQIARRPAAGKFKNNSRLIFLTFPMLLQLHPVNPQPRNIKMIIECLLDGGVIIYPTDTIYGLGCDIFQHKAVERICRIKQVDPARAQLSFICYDLS